jgi:SAM-dependent methyltransferase
VLTVRYDLLGVHAGHAVLDLGCGAGRHTFEALARGARTISVDIDDAALKNVKGMTEAMEAEGQVPAQAASGCCVGDALHLPFETGSFDRLIASEVLEHITEDERAMAEIARVLRPGGKAVVTVPRFWTEAVNWSLSREYRGSAGGHVRIYRRAQLSQRLRRAGLVPFAMHHAHAFHSPYWWLRSLVGVSRDDSPPVRAYHRFLVWDIEKSNALVRRFERTLDPLLGKSVAIYVEKVAGA